MKSASVDTSNVCQPLSNQVPSSCNTSSPSCPPPLTTEVAECCAVVKSAETVVGDDRTKLDGLRWDMIKIKEKVNVELTEEEKTIARNPRP
jgi:hypothetical protein